MRPRISIIGSCFSRNFLNKHDFFNPDYKKYFKNINDDRTLWHFSMISRFNKNDIIKEIDFGADKINNWTNKDYTHLYRDSDYIIVDLYADSIGVFHRSVNNYFPDIPRLKNNNDFFSKFKGDKFCYKDFPEKYINKFKESVVCFKKELKDNCFQEEKIILNIINYGDSYYSLEGKILKYQGEWKKKIKIQNEIAPKLEKEFLKIIPGAKVLKMNYNKYIGDEKYPFGFDPAHYESKFYKDFIIEVLNIINPKKVIK